MTLEGEGSGELAPLGAAEEDTSAVPLLDEGSVERDAQSASDADGEDAPFPIAKCIVLCSILFCDQFALTQIFPYIAFMIRDEFHMTDDTKRIGYYAGFLGEESAWLFLWGLTN